MITILTSYNNAYNNIAIICVYEVANNNNTTTSDNNDNNTDKL